MASIKQKDTIDMESLKRLCQMRISKEGICISLEIDEETLDSYLRQEGYISFSEFYEEQSKIIEQELLNLLAKSAESGVVPQFCCLN